ncbi:MAG: hypothetical protein IPK07_33430 [Deltaproteobacteria bacterium]|nr:hypothetical protein [Deltaproteobacteria bacterium]
MRFDPTYVWACADNEACVADYQTFLSEAADAARPIDQATLDEALVGIARGEVPVVAPGLPPEELRREVVERLNVGWLVAGLASRPLEAIVTSETSSDFFREAHLVLRDEMVGDIPAILLRPLGEGPYPAIVAVHGHGDDAQVYRDAYHGSEYPGHGYAILILTMRAMGIDEVEHDISKRILRAGFALIGLRSYESLVGLEYLRSRSDVRDDRIGLIGHSGGSSTGNLTIRVMPSDGPARFRAYVSDHEVDFFVSGLFEPYHCETVPALYPLHRAINDLQAAPIPTLTVPYAYPFGVAGIFRFFDQHLVR